MIILFVCGILCVFAAGFCGATAIYAPTPGTKAANIVVCIMDILTAVYVFTKIFSH